MEVLKVIRLPYPNSIRDELFSAWPIPLEEKETGLIRAKQLDDCPFCGGYGKRYVVHNHTDLEMFGWGKCDRCDGTGKVKSSNLDHAEEGAVHNGGELDSTGRPKQ